eukprot:CAMPEP_0185774788 /NCGR_PEP_ID=MMETSP1174-20130828/79851_1 /TAXON_ID=35687 /ORGANISM="Dictyocha speculum, Strain CCMP1381" /LENGTH=75 /DNA_ID=CAMNT_0028462139 /DNA_START=30 /DNA_END=253 /DNA_ORIENTATION=-
MPATAVAPVDDVRGGGGRKDEVGRLDSPEVRPRLKRFAMGRHVEVYGEELQRARVVYVTSGQGNASQRILQHHYA